MKHTAFFVIALLLTAYVQPLTPQPMMMPTEEELIKMNQEIEAFRSSMTEEQRNDFDKQVQELSKVMENMSEDELNKFIETVFSQEAESLMTPPTPTPAPAPDVKQPEPVAKEVKPAEPLYKESRVAKKDKESAKRMIVLLINTIESFLRKTTLIPDLYGPLHTWVPAAIAGKTDLTWQTLKQEIERLISSLRMILTTDPATGHYYYLGSLIENDSLYQTIIRLNDTLTRNEPTITVTAFGLSDIGKETRKATETILSAFVQTIYTQQLIQEIQKLISAFAPEAKKVSEQEEAARKRAIEESKKTAMQAPMRLAGTLYDDYTTGYKPGTTEPSFDSTSYTPASPYKAPASADQAYERPETLTSKKPTETPAIKPGEKTEKEKEDAAKKQKSEAVPVKTDAADKIIEKIETFIEDCIIAIKAKKLDTTVMNDDKQETVSEIAGKIARITSRIKTLETVMKDYTTAQKNMFLDRIKVMIKNDKDLFDIILSTIEANKSSAPAAALELHAEITSLFKKLDMIHTKKTIKPQTPKPATKIEAASGATPSPAVEEQAKMRQERELVRTRASSAEIHPAALPAGVTEGVSDIHPAALMPSEE